MKRYVIIGSGVAGISALEEIRTLDHEGEVVMIGDEPQVYYSRPGLAYYLSKEISGKQLFPYRKEDYARLNFRWVNARVSRIQPEIHRVFLDDGKSIAFSKLLVAVGASAAMQLDRLKSP